MVEGVCEEKDVGEKIREVFRNEMEEVRIRMWGFFLVKWVVTRVKGYWLIRRFF